MCPQDEDHVRPVRLADFYDIFVDWPGRLARELPGIEARLDGARRVLDVGCGTGRHVGALLERGYDAYGVDPSPEMLAHARDHVGEEGRFLPWALGEPVSPALAEWAPFDAILAMGNVWPQVHGREAEEHAARALFGLLRPGGRLLLGLKAFGVRRASGNPYLPLLRREVNGSPRWFVRFIELDRPGLEDGTPVGCFHMLAVSDEEQAHHRSGTVRFWEPDELETFFQAAGFEEVTVSGTLADAASPPRGEDVFVGARRPE